MLNDRLLTRLATSSAAPVRLWAARKAAERTLHWAALAGAPDDPYVLARLGLYPLALEHPARDAQAELGRNLARAALGQADAATRTALASARPGHRKLAAKLLALHDCDAAIELLEPDDRLARAACYRALGEPERAAELIRQAPSESREAAAIRAAAAAGLGNYAEARQALNAMFASDGLVAPLLESSAPYGIDDLGGSAQAAREGPKVSVVIPYHDAAATLETAVLSIARQSWRNVEILLVDDRSADGGPAIAHRLAQADDRIVALANIRKPGVYGARNTAIDAATGSHVTFLDADDWSPVERIKRQLDGLTDHPVAIANHIRMDETGRPVAPRIFPIVRPVPITMMLRRETLMAAGPFEELATGADTEMLSRLEMIGGKQSIHRDPAVLLVARWQSGSLSRDAEGGLLGRERYDYRAEWMFRHAGMGAPRLPRERAAE